MLAKSINKDTHGFAFSDLEASVWPFLNWNHEVLHFLIINLTHHGNNFVMFIFVCVSFDSLEYLFSGQGDDSFVLSITYHRVRLA